MECQYVHIGSAVACSGDAEFRLLRHGKQKVICRAAAQLQFTQSNGRCYECRRPKWTHWDLEEL